MAASKVTAGRALGAISSMRRGIGEPTASSSVMGKAKVCKAVIASRLQLAMVRNRWVEATARPISKVDTVRRAAMALRVTGSKAKAAFTLRLDPDRHLKLRLACAVGGRSAQQLVTDALDQLLAGMPELEAMAEKAKRKG